MSALAIYILPILVPLICIISIPFILIWSWHSISKERKKQERSELTRKRIKEGIANDIQYNENIAKERKYQEALYAKHNEAFSKYLDWTHQQFAIHLDQSQPQYKDMTSSECINYLHSQTQKETMIRHFMGEDIYSEYCSMIEQIEERTRKLRETL